MGGRSTAAARRTPGIPAAICEQEPRLDALPDETPEGIRRLLRRALTKDPRSRLRDIADARLELTEALDVRPAADAPIRPLGSGAPVLVDVEFGPGLRLYGLSQGHFTPGNPEGSPADSNTGALVELRPGGGLQVVVDKLNQPTSLEFIGDTAYVLTIAGEIWKIRNVGRSRGHAWH
jgi:hypothetical protein